MDSSGLSSTDRSMMRGFFDWCGYTLILVKLTIWIVLPQDLESQSLPTRHSDYFGIDPKRLFYDTNRIPDGLEVSPYLLFNETKRYFFLVEEERPRIDITITPCASPVRWHVTYKKDFVTDPSYEVGEGAGTAPGVQGRGSLHTYSGEVAETFRLQSPQPGLYTLEITALRSDSYVKLFASTSPDIDRYPELPSDATVSVLGTNKRSFVVAWKQSPDERHYGGHIEYCVAVNRKKNYKTLCSLLSHIHGDAKPTFPPQHGFGFQHESHLKKRLRQIAKPIRGEKKGSILYKCVGRETRFIYDKAKKGRGYYVDVFVRNNQTQKSSQYKGIFVQTVGDKSLSTLKDGKFKNVLFRKRKQNRTFKFRVRGFTKQLTLAVHSCSGSVSVEMRKRNVTLLKSKVKGFKTLTLRNVQPGKYLVRLSSSTRKRKTVNILATTRSSKFRFPTLPDDTTVKIFENDNLTNCNSITLALLGTDTKQEYCLYKTELRQVNDTRRFKKANYCDAPHRRKKSQKILCKKFRHRSKNKAVLAITVAGLSPGTSYIFDVFVNKDPHFSIPYNSVRTQTKSECQASAMLQLQ